VLLSTNKSYDNSLCCSSGTAAGCGSAVVAMGKAVRKSTLLYYNRALQLGSIIKTLYSVVSLEHL